MVHHVGHRARAPLYATAFASGITKARTAIERALQPLTLDQVALNEAKMGVARGRKLRAFVEEAFKSDGYCNLHPMLFHLSDLTI